MAKEKVCVLCGKKFFAEKNAQRVCSDTHYRACEVCGTKFVITTPSDWKRCCSKTCTLKLRQNTMIDRFGVAHALQSPELLKKAEETTEARFGVKHAAQSEEVKARTQAHFQSTYGVPTPFQMKDFQEKATKTCMERYGVQYTSQIPGRTEKMQATNIERYGSLSPMGNADIQARFRADMEDKFGVPYYVMTEECRKAQRHVISTLNKQVAARMEQVGLHPVLEKRLDRFSYDIALDSQSVLIEVDPTYTHNAVGNHFTDEGLKPSYHKEKSDVAKKYGYRCIHIFDWDDVNKIVLSLTPRQSIYARKCHVECIPETGARDFCDRYHFQGSCRGQKVCYGLFYQGELVQLMTFGKPRYNKNYQWELLRLCTKFGVTIVGGAQRLWAHFIHEHHPESVISYCDLSKFTGDVYERLGFKLLRVNTPKKIWSKGTEYMTETFVNQRGFDQIFGANFGKGTNNAELMLQHDWLPVYDCGQAVYVIIIR